MSVMPKPVLALYNNVTGNMSVIMTTYYLALYENVYTLLVTWNMNIRYFWTAKQVGFSL